MELSKKEIYYIYVFFDPRKPGNFVYEYNGEILEFDYEPFYVGKGVRDRFNDHFRKDCETTNTPFYDKLRSILRAKPNLRNVKERFGMYTIIIRNLNEETAYKKESELIEIIGSNFISEIKDGPLTNYKLRQFEIGRDLVKRGEGHCHAKITEGDVLDMLKMMAQKIPIKEIAVKYSHISKNVKNIIKDIKSQNTWKEVSDKFFAENEGVSFCFNRSPFSQVEQIKIIADLDAGMKVGDVAKKYNTYHGKISRVANRKLFKQAWRTYDEQQENLKNN